ncbi:uncharacterized protein LAESUDRAFT_652866, partial [Laetiporus sulphureus 93-53]
MSLASIQHEICDLSLPVKIFVPLTFISWQLIALSEHTGMQMILFAMRSTPESYRSLHVFYTNDCLSDFIEFTMKSSVADFSARMDGYVLSGVDALIKQKLSKSRFIHSALMLTSLIEEASPCPVVQLTYVNFETNVMIPYWMLIKGWPLSKFCCPSNIGTCMEVQLCLTAWE